MMLPRLSIFLVFALALCLCVVTLSSTSRAQTPPPVFEFGGYCNNTGTTTLYMIDRTQIYDAEDIAALKRSAISVMATLGEGNRVDIIDIVDDPRSSQRAFSACYPGCGDRWLSCDTISVGNEQNMFKAKYVEAIEMILSHSDNSLRRSAIAQTISQQILHYPSVNQIFLFSDMLENDTNPLGARIFLGNEQQHSQIDAYLSGVEREDVRGIMRRTTDVRIVWMQKSLGNKQSISDQGWSNIRRFWNEYFKFLEAKNVRFN